MTDGGTHKVCFAGSSVLVDYDGAVGRRIVDFLYRDIPEAGAAEPHVTLKIDTLSEAGTLRALRGEVPFYQGDSAGTLANLLVSETIYHLADKSSGGLLLHAGAVSRGARCMIFPGQTGAGKTTLTAWLLRRGLNYLSDELVYLAFGSRDIQTFTRPLNVKTDGLQVLRDQMRFDPCVDGTLRSSNAALVPHRLLNPVHSDETPELRVVVFPVHRPGADFELVRLSKAQTGMRLMEFLVNARNLPGHGFDEVVRLVTFVDAYMMLYSRFAQIGDKLGEILDQSASG